MRKNSVVSIAIVAQFLVSSLGLASELRQVKNASVLLYDKIQKLEEQLEDLKKQVNLSRDEIESYDQAFETQKVKSKSYQISAWDEQQNKNVELSLATANRGYWGGTFHDYLTVGSQFERISMPSTIVNGDILVTGQNGSYPALRFGQGGDQRAAMTRQGNDLAINPFKQHEKVKISGKVESRETIQSQQNLRAKGYVALGHKLVLFEALIAGVQNKNCDQKCGEQGGRCLMAFAYEPNGRKMACDSKNNRICACLAAAPASANDFSGE